MPDVLSITTPIFLLIGLGYGAVRCGLCQAVNAAYLLVSTVASFGTLALVIWSLHAAWDVLLPP